MQTPEQTIWGFAACAHNRRAVKTRGRNRKSLQKGFFYSTPKGNLYSTPKGNLYSTPKGNLAPYAVSQENDETLF
jgi:hypothetical protein